MLELGIGYEYELSNHARRGHDVTENPKEEITEFSTVNLRASYALAPRLRLHCLVPIRSILAPKTDLSSGERFLRDFSGVGDVLVSGTWLPYVSTNSDQTVVAMTMGLRLATGSSDPDHDWGFGNSRDPVLQPGYGTVDPLLGISAARKVGRFGANVSAVTRLSGGTNVHGYRYADEYQGTAGLTYPMSSWLEAGISGAVLTAAHDFDQGAMVQNTGGLWGYLIPQATLKSAGVRLEPSVQIPVYAFVNGGQLVSDAIYSIGLSFDVGRNRAVTGVIPREMGMARGLRPANMRYASGCTQCGIANVVSQESMTLVEFMSEQCGACQEFEPTLANFASQYPSLAVRQVDLFSLSQQQIAELGIEETPTMMLFDVNGTVKQKVTGTDLKQIEKHLLR